MLSYIVDMYFPIYILMNIIHSELWFALYTLSIRIYSRHIRTGGHLNIKMPSYQYVKDKTVSPTVLSLNMGIPIPGKDGLYIETGSRFHLIVYQ